MARTRRQIHARQPYELILRVRSGLPFATLATISLLLKSALARSQRDEKVTICHMVWMANHVHFIIVPGDTEACLNFFQEVQKKITEYMKRLLGKDQLNLWEGEPVLAIILDEQALIDRIAYIYGNPAAANLVETISEYPGLSSWAEFEKLPPDISAQTSEMVPWIRLPSVPQLPTLTLTDEQDQRIASKMKERAKINHKLILRPNACMKAFGISTSRGIQSINDTAKACIREKEQQARTLRASTGKTVLGARKLRRQPIMMAHTPKKRVRRIYCFSSIKEVRIAFIESTRAFCRSAYSCYQAWKEGNWSVQWPPGAIRPYMRPIATVLA